MQVQQSAGSRLWQKRGADDAAQHFQIRVHCYAQTSGAPGKILFPMVAPSCGMEQSRLYAGKAHEDISLSSMHVAVSCRAPKAAFKHQRHTW